MRHAKVAGLTVVVLFLGVPGAAAWAGVVGTLSTSSGDWITGSQLSSWIDELIPGGSDRLIVLTQCYGGDMVGDFAGKGNTAVASATAAGEQSQYGGYDSGASGSGGASGGLRPGGGRTAQDVHDAGMNGHAGGESGSTGGGKALSSFPLDPVDPFGIGNVLSRHVLVYAGKPDGGTGRDNAQRDTIRSNFLLDATVTTVGGDGTGGWDQPGTAKGLRQALKGIGDAIGNNPKEQFILFVTDHGDRHNVETLPPWFSVGANSHSFWTMQPFTSTSSFNAATLAADPGNVPGFSIFIDFNANHIQRPTSAGPLFQPGDWGLELTPPTPGGTRTLSSFFDVFTELSVDGSNVIGDQPGEGERLFFPMDEGVFTADFMNGGGASFNILNHTSTAYNVSEFSQDSGFMAKTAVPEPCTVVLMAAGVLAVLLRRLRR